MQALPVLRFLRHRIEQGERAVLVTLTWVSGSAARAPGECMAVSEGGMAMGSFSGGCVEAAVIAEAKDVLRAGTPLHVRFGAGSPYFDIRLPCGGGIDLMFVPDPGQISLAIALPERRQPALLSLSSGGALRADEAFAFDRTGWTGGSFRRFGSASLVVL